MQTILVCDDDKESCGSDRDLFTAGRLSCAEGI